MRDPRDRPVRIRPGHGDDLVALTAIYNHYVRATAVTFDVAEFSIDARRAWVDSHAERGRYRLLVAEVNGSAIGWASSGTYRARAAFETTVETAVYLAPGETGRGIGTTLYGALFESLEGEDVHRAVAAITLPNEASVRLHRRLGFTAVGRFSESGRKFGRFWDVLWMERPVGAARRT